MSLQQTVTTEAAQVAEKAGEQSKSPTTLITVTGTPGATYGAPEQQILTDVQTELNKVLTILRGQGVAS